MIQASTHTLTRSWSRPALLQILLGLTFLAMNFQNLPVFGNSDAAIKVYHLIGVIVFPVLLLRKPLAQFNITVTSFFILISFQSYVGYTFFGFNFMLLNYAFAFYSFWLGSSLFIFYGWQKSLTMLRFTTLFMFIAVFVKSLIFWDVIKNFLANPNGHPTLPFFYGGGPNLESTWLTLFCLFFLRTKLYYPLAFASLILSILYASRVGTILAILVMLYPLIPTSVSTLRRIIPLSILVISLLIILVFANPEAYILQRFSDIGTDPGSQGRLQIWINISEAFWQNPFGYGAGNAISSIEHLTDRPFIEDNLHNYYAQVLLDFGVIGFIYYLYMISSLYWQEVKKKFQHPLGGFLLLFMVASLIQFRGAESIPWFIAGIYCANLKHNELEEMTHA